MKKEKINKESKSDLGVRATHIYANMLDQMRYIYTLNYIVGKDVLDIACGVGWGTYVMSKVASNVYGVDLSDTAINTAKKFYNQDNIKYYTNFLENCNILDSSIDIVTSFETLEHIDEPQLFLNEIFKVIKPNGILFISTPNGASFKKLRSQKPYNPFHVEEYEKQDILNMINEKWKVLEYKGQFPMNDKSKTFSNYSNYIKDYWLGMRLKKNLGLFGQLIFILLGKLNFIKLREPAYIDSCTPVNIEENQQPAYHFFVLTPKK